MKIKQNGYLTLQESMDGWCNEVLVKITKKCLKMIAKDCLLNEETLPTVLAEVKGITKTRYLTIKTI